MKNHSYIARYRALQHGYVYAYKRDTSTRYTELEEQVLCRRYIRAGKILYSSCFYDEIGKRIPKKINEKHIVENVYYNSLGELNRLCKRIEYYTCNAQLFIRYMDKISREIVAGNILQRDIARSFLFESIYLLQEYSLFNRQTPTDFGVGKASQTHVRNMFINSRSLSWTGTSQEIDLGAATIRLAIENRIRSALGIYGLYNTKTNEMLPVKMSKIFAVLKKNENAIQIDTSIDIISRIYSWSNNYIHSLYRNYPWLILFAHDLIAPIFLPAKHQEYFGLNHSIRMTENTMREIRNIENYIDRENQNWKINGPDIEHCAFGVLR